MTSPKSARWRGAWPEGVLIPFLVLTSEESIKTTEAGPSPVASLLGGAPPPEAATARGERIEDFRARVRGHEAYRRLQGYAGLKLIMQYRRQLATGNALFGEPFGEIRLLREIALVVGTHYGSFAPNRATLTQQRKVQRATKTLSQLLMPGAELTDIFEMSELWRLLKKLDGTLATMITNATRLGKRPARADKDAAQRYWLVVFCKNLIKSFGVAPPTIVKEVANMIGYTPDESTIGRYVARANREHAALARELRARFEPQITAKTPT